MSKFSIIGWTFSLTTVSFLTLVIFYKALMNAIEDWFMLHNTIILIASSILLFIFLATGVITIASIKSKGKTMVE